MTRLVSVGHALRGNPCGACPAEARPVPVASPHHATTHDIRQKARAIMTPTTTTRVTKEIVVKLAELVAEASGGRIALGEHGNPGDGLRYLDAHDDDRVFSGKTATREAALFYGFAAHEWIVRDGGYPEPWVDEVLLTLLDSPTLVTRAGDAGLDHVAEIYRPSLRAVA